MREFSKTPKQFEAIDLLASKANNVMLYGGSRSGKTFILVYAIICRALKVKSRHISFRLKFNHIKGSIWHDTLPKVLSICFPGLEYKLNSTDYFVTFPNGSEYWIGGLDDKDRTEKILGKEYSTIHFNECSQIPFSSIQIAKSRLAERNELTKKVYYDENPPHKSHWSYWTFIKKIDPQSSENLKNPEKYQTLLMNPEDNKDNIAEDYLTDILDQLPEKERNRFKYGMFSDEGEGLIYYAFNRETHVAPTPRSRHLPIYVGMDFNINPMSAIVANVTKDSIYVFDEFYLQSSNTHEMAQAIVEKYGRGHKIIPDSTGKALKTSAAGQSDHSILKSQGFQIPSVKNPYRMDRYNVVNSLLEKGRIVIDPKCKNLIRDFEQVAYKSGTNIPDTTDPGLTHISDSLGYLAWYLFPIVHNKIGVSRYA